MKVMICILMLIVSAGCASKQPETGNPLMRWLDENTMTFEDGGLLEIGGYHSVQSVGYHSVQSVGNVFYLFCVADRKDNKAVLELLIGDIQQRPVDCRNDVRLNPG